jgi:hypothetical protein
MSVNILTAMNTGNNRRRAVSMQWPVNTPFKNVATKKETIFYVIRAKQTHGTIGRLLPGNEAVNRHP